MKDNIKNMKTKIIACLTVLFTLAAPPRVQSSQIAGYTIIIPDGPSITISLEGDLVGVASPSNDSVREKGGLVTLTFDGKIFAVTGTPGNITRNMHGTITNIGNAHITRNMHGTITSITGDNNVQPAFMLLK